MGPVGYGRGGMSLAGLVRGMGGGYGGYNPYQMQMARMAQMQGGYGMRPVGPQANDIQGAAQQQSAYASQLGSAAAEQPSIQAVAPQENTITGAEQGGGLTPQQRAFLGNGPGVWNSGPVNDAGSPFWQRLQAGMAQSAGQPSSFTPAAPQENTIQGAYGAPARGMGASAMGMGWGGPMSLGALARMGMFRR